MKAASIFSLFAIFAPTLFGATELSIRQSINSVNEGLAAIEQVNQFNGFLNCGENKNYTDDESRIVAECMKRALTQAKAHHSDFFQRLRLGQVQDYDLFAPETLLARDEQITREANRLNIFTALKEKKYAVVYLKLQNDSDPSQQDANGKSVIDYLTDNIEEKAARDLLKMLAGEFINDPTLKSNNHAAGNTYLKSLNECYGLKHAHLNSHNRMLRLSMLDKNGQAKHFVLSALKSPYAELRDTYRKRLEEQQTIRRETTQHQLKQLRHDLAQAKFKYEVRESKFKSFYTADKISQAASVVARLSLIANRDANEEKELQDALTFLQNYQKDKDELQKALSDYRSTIAVYDNLVLDAAINELKMQQELKGEVLNNIDAGILAKKFSDLYDATLILKFTDRNEIADKIEKNWNSQTLNKQSVLNEINQIYANQSERLNKEFTYLDSLLLKDHITSSFFTQTTLREINHLQDELNDPDYLGEVKRAMLIVHEVEANKIPLHLNLNLEKEYQKAKILLGRYKDKEFLLAQKIKKQEDNHDRLREDLLRGIREAVAAKTQINGGKELTDDELLNIVSKFINESYYVFEPDSTENKKKFLELFKNQSAAIEGQDKKLNLLELVLRKTHYDSETNQKEISRIRKAALLKPIELPHSNANNLELNQEMLDDLQRASCFQYKYSVDPEIDCDNLTDDKLFGDFGRWFQREILNDVKKLWDRIGNEVKRAYNRVTDVIKYPRANFADFTLRLVKAPIEVYRKENFELAWETLAGSYDLLGDMIDGGMEALAWATGSARNAIDKICKKGERSSRCGNVGALCDLEGNCVLTDGNGNPSDVIIPRQMDWDEALQWMKKTELDDFLRDLQNNPSPHLENLFRNQEERRTFASLAQTSLDKLRQQLENAQNPQEREALLAQINSQKELLDFLKGVGVGAFNNIKDAINAVLELPETMTHAGEMLSMAVRFYESTSFIEMFEMAEGSLISKWEELQAADPARRGEMLGYLGTDMLLALLPAGAAARFGSTAVREALQGSRLADGFAELAESLSRFAPSREGLQNFLSIVGNEFGGVGDFTEIARRIDGIKYPDVWTQGRFRDSLINAHDHFSRHGHQFGARGTIDYVEMTYDFVRSPPNGSLRKLRENGDILIYHPGTNTFASVSPNGVARTMYKPDDGINFWERQHGTPIE